MALQTNILSKLTGLIESYPNYLVEGVINKNLLAADARKYDASLLNLLLKDADIKKHFFTDTEDGLIFKKISFCSL
jgi:adenine-specific DNA-methyltransferase